MKNVLIINYTIWDRYFCTFGRHGPVVVPVVVVHGRQVFQFRLVPDEHVLGAGRAVVRAARGRRGRRRPGGTSATATAARAAVAATAAAAAVAAATERRLLQGIIIIVVPAYGGHVHAGHEADAGLLLLGLYPAAAASIPSAAGHQRGPPPDGGQLQLLLVPPDPSQRIGVSPPSSYTLSRRLYYIMLFGPRTKHAHTSVQRHSDLRSYITVLEKKVGGHLQGQRSWTEGAICIKE